ncbi:uncharacterized protein LOC122853998 [Aphidius gifuensis]|uniref:uncharacterized protein LOC122853998 n=1 Tax=Aphidius gifuensis TaxID=684658 RepID=UPI001CDD55A6|nr:uncharacterized protein LOC122853998 [Aphidius gifuensis]
MKFLLPIFGLILITSVLAVHKECSTRVKINARITKYGELISVSKKPDNSSQTGCTRWIYMMNSHLSSIEAHAFNNDLQIKELLINNLKKELRLTQDSFAGLGQLDSLTIYSTIISEDRRLFKHVGNITKLELVIHESNADIIGDSFTDLKNLKKLTIAESKTIATIDFAQFFKAIPSIIDLTFLYCETIIMQSLAKASLKKLKQLNFLYSQIDHLTPGDFDGFTELESLSIISDVNNPNVINIQKNVFNNITHLKKLRIQYSGIIIQNNSFSRLYLDELDLSHNSFNVIKVNDKTFNGLGVDKLDLSFNDNIVIQEGAFEKTTINTLYLIDTGITEDNDTSIWQFSHLPEIIFDLPQPTSLT